MDCNNEYWEDIPGFNGEFQASTHGRIKNAFENAILNQVAQTTKGDKNYLKCSIKGRPYVIHRLVALTFIPNPDNKPYVDHIDFNEQNNRSENLRWVTAKENSQHSKFRMRNKKTGAGHYRSLFTEKQLSEIEALRRGYMSYAEIASRFGVRENTICAIFYRLRKYKKRESQNMPDGKL
jgi:hypothetical protein